MSRVLRLTHLYFLLVMEIFPLRGLHVGHVHCEKKKNKQNKARFIISADDAGIKNEMSSHPVNANKCQSMTVS